MGFWEGPSPFGLKRNQSSPTIRQVPALAFAFAFAFALALALAFAFAFALGWVG